MDFHPTRGSEQEGRPHALIVQNDRGNESAPTTVAAALTTRVPSGPFPVIVALAAGEGGLREAGSVNCAQLLTVDQSRLTRRNGKLSEERMREVEEALRYELGLGEGAAARAAGWPEASAAKTGARQTAARSRPLCMTGNEGGRVA